MKPHFLITLCLFASLSVLSQEEFPLRKGESHQSSYSQKLKYLYNSRYTSESPLAHYIYNEKYLLKIQVLDSVVNFLKYSLEDLSLVSDETFEDTPYLTQRVKYFNSAKQYYSIHRFNNRYYLFFNRRYRKEGKSALFAREISIEKGGFVGERITIINNDHGVSKGYYIQVSPDGKHLMVAYEEYHKKDKPDKENAAIHIFDDEFKEKSFKRESLLFLQRYSSDKVRGTYTPYFEWTYGLNRSNFVSFSMVNEESYKNKKRNNLNIYWTNNEGIYRNFVRFDDKYARPFNVIIDGQDNFIHYGTLHNERIKDEGVPFDKSFESYFYIKLNESGEILMQKEIQIPFDELIKYELESKVENMNKKYAQGKKIDRKRQRDCGSIMDEENNLLLLFNEYNEFITSPKDGSGNKNGRGYYVAIPSDCYLFKLDDKADLSWMCKIPWNARGELKGTSAKPYLFEYDNNYMILIEDHKNNVDLSVSDLPTGHNFYKNRALLAYIVDKESGEKTVHKVLDISALGDIHYLDMKSVIVKNDHLYVMAIYHDSRYQLLEIDLNGI